MPALAIQQPCYINQKQKATIYNFPKQKTLRRGKSTEMECLYNKDEILSVYNVFKKDVDNATTVNKEKNAMRNLTMFICAINIGLRGGDFCKLTWKDVYEDGWKIKKSQKFVPEKTERRNRCGNIIKRKYVKLRYDSDFKMAIQNWYKWLEDHSEKNILLSTALPEDEELEQVMKDSSYFLIKRSGFVDSSEYALQQMRKRDLYVFSSGSCFAHTFRGRIIEERNGGKHPVFRYAKAFFMGV